MTRKSLLWPLSAMLLIASACGSPAREQRTTSPPITVRTVLAATDDVADRLEAGGTVAARESAIVSSRVVAPVLAVRVRAGDRVHAGDVLVTLDARDVAAQTRQANAAAVAAERALAQARDEQAVAVAEHKLASAWHQRIAGLRDKNSATAQEFDEAEARLSAATARVGATGSAVEQVAARIDAVRAAADAAAITESFTTLRAPFDGVVSERLIDPGNLATAGMPLVRVDADGPRHVEVRVDEARARFVRRGDRVPVVVDSRSGGAGEREIDGTVTEVARAVAADERAFTVKVGLPADASPLAGSFARVRFRGDARTALTVPANAVLRRGQVTSLFVVQDGVARLRLIQAGVTAGETTEVLAGLDPGEAVVVTPPASLTDGRPVSVTGPAESPGARP